jgi:drug/metabolite transporter (DMT)-like permease
VSPRAKAQLQIHVCVVLWGLTAILGKLISLSALHLVWWRMVIVTAVLLAAARVRRGLRAMDGRLRWAFAGVGLVIALHWLTFYGAIKLANASVAATCMALTPIFVSLVEPAVSRRRFEARELFFGVIALPGVALVAGGTPGRMRLGLAVGVFSSLCVAIFSVLNKRLVHRADALSVTCLELGSGAAMLTLVAALVPHDGPAFPLPSPRDAVLLLVLSLGCTVVPFALSLVALRQLSAFSISFAVNLEPVYSVLLAVALFHEQRELSAGFYAGVAIVLGSVVAHSLLTPRGVGLPQREDRHGNQPLRLDG